MWVSIVEWTVLERLYADAASRAFVVESVRGVLAGTPVSRSWQHRFVAPLFVSLLGGDLDAALERARLVLLLASNGLLSWLALRRGSWTRALGVVAVYVAGRLLLAYKLEYGWDGVDQLLFLGFGALAAEERGVGSAWPLLALGAVNHETIFYAPLWYLLSFERARVRDGALASLAIGAAVLGLRQAFYRGRPSLPGQTFEEGLPLVDNHLHVAHNLRQLFVEDWTSGRAHVALGFFGAVAAFAWMCARPSLRRGGAWSLVVLATIVCFGYVNETRHYLVLLAFWCAYAATKAPRRSPA